MDDQRLLRTNRSIVFISENFFVRGSFAADTRECATTATDFRANGSEICANRIQNAPL